MLKWGSIGVIYWVIKINWLSLNYVFCVREEKFIVIVLVEYLSVQSRHY